MIPSLFGTEHLAFRDDVVVLESGSTSGAVAIAEGAGRRDPHLPFRRLCRAAQFRHRDGVFGGCALELGAPKLGFGMRRGDFSDIAYTAIAFAPRSIA